MANINPKFKLKDQRKNPSLIVLKVYFDKYRFTYSTGEKIDPMYWDIPDKDESYRIIYPRQGKDSKTFRDNLHETAGQLNRYEAEIKKIFSYLRAQGIQLTPGILKKEMDKVFKVQPDHSQGTQNLNQFIDNFIKEIESGKRITENSKEHYKSGTIKNYKGFQVQFNEYQKKEGRVFDFNDITIDFYEDFTNYFNSKNYSPNTIGRHIKCLKTLMRISKEQGLHNNLEYQRRKFKAMKIDTQEIYLTEEEIKKIYELDLSNEPYFDVIRDVFLVGCYTGLRYSDYSRINKIHIKTTGKNTRVIDLKTQKTGERVIIPIRPELDSILKKYDYNLPKTHEQKVNREIKKIGHRVGITEDVRIETIRGGLKVSTTCEKSELIKTHTARRSAATNMYQAGIKTIDIMKITGHTLESNFLKYIKVTKEETADILATHPYFTGKGKLRVVK